jgi:hypothetical protein
LVVPLVCQKLILDSCSGTLALTTKILPGAASGKARASKKRKPPKKRPKARTIKVGGGGFHLAPGATGGVTVTLTPRGAAALAKQGKLSITATASSRDRAGGISKATQTFVLIRAR